MELYEFFKGQGAAVINDAADFAGTNGCYLYQGRDVKEGKDRSLKDQILVITPHEGLVSSDTWLKCRKKLMANITFQNGRKARNTWLAGKVKCGKCGYALKVTRNPSGYEYLWCNKRSDHKGCPGCGTLRKVEFEQFIFNAMGEKFRDFQHLRGGEEKANPKLTAYQVELAQAEAEIEKLLDLLSGYLDDWENISFEDKRKATDGLISSISATSEYVKIGAAAKLGVSTIYSGTDENIRPIYCKALLFCNSPCISETFLYIVCSPLYTDVSVEFYI